MKKKNEEFIMNDYDKKLGTAAAEKKDDIKECTRQLYGIDTSLKLSAEEADMSIAKIHSERLEVINKYTSKQECSKKKQTFC